MTGRREDSSDERTDRGWGRAESAATRELMAIVCSTVIIIMAEIVVAKAVAWIGDPLMLWQVDEAAS
jgi:hypothetical protein